MRITKAIFHPRKRRSSVLAIAALLVASSVSASAQITIDHTLNVGFPGGNDGATGLAIVASYDASGADKLVVVISSEHAFGIGVALLISSIEYNGQLMIEAVQEDTLPGTTALFYLDSPGAAGEIRLFTGNKNGGLATVYALSGVAPGVAAIGKSTLDAVNITTTSANSLVIAAIMDGGQGSTGNGAVAPTAPLPMTQVHSGTWGNNWGAHASGYEIVAAPGPVAMTFGTAGLLRLRTVAAAFGEGGSGVSNPFCFGNGSSGVCPCGNIGQGEAGCANSWGQGASIVGSGSASVVTDDLTFAVTNLAPMRPALLLMGTSDLNGGAGVYFGDGLLCSGGAITFFGVKWANGGGATTWGPGLATQGSIAPGSSGFFQVIYRDTYPGSPCGSFYNSSNGSRVNFLP